MLLSGRSAVVTGGSRGVGLEICRILLENGARVLAVSRDPAKLDQAREAQRGLMTLPADVSSPGDVDAIAAWVKEKWGRLDLLFNNAGVYLDKGDELTGQSDEAFDSTWRVNVLGPYLCTKRLLPWLLRSDSPRVVSLGSTLGIISPSLRGAYGVTKAALHAMTIALANELRGKVAVNCLSPGWVRTDMSPDAPRDAREAAESALWLVTQPRELTGRFFEDRQELPWSYARG